MIVALVAVLWVSYYIGLAVLAVYAYRRALNWRLIALIVANTFLGSALAVVSIIAITFYAGGVWGPLTFILGLGSFIANQTILIFKGFQPLFRSGSARDT